MSTKKDREEKIQLSYLHYLLSWTKFLIYLSRFKEGEIKTKLVIVGSQCTYTEDSIPIIEGVIERLKPEVVGSGGALGTDTHTEIYCRTHNIKFKKFPPQVRRWHDHMGKTGFKSRNMKMAKWGDKGIRIASRRSKSYGSGWTIDQMEKMGKVVERHEVR